MKILSNACIWDKAKHNALTDLIYYKNTFFCCFREGTRHAGFGDGVIRILTSKDAIEWTEAACIKKDDIDLRDPKFSRMPDGRLMLTMGGSVYEGKILVGLSPHVAFSENGFDWSPAIDLEMDGEWIWQVSWHKGIGYGTSYRQTDLADSKKPWQLHLFKTFDGIDYTHVKQLDITERPSETTLRFTKDDTMIALMRCIGKGFIGHSKAPYTEWSWHETEYQLGGPNFIMLPDGQMWAGSRYIEHEGKKKNEQMGIYKMSIDSLKLELLLPSGGDCSYPGMVFHEGKLYVSYYSSHEKKAKIYLAILEQ